MFSYNLKDKLIVLGFVLLVDLIFYPWLNAIMLTSLAEYLPNIGFVAPAWVIMNWPSVFNNAFATQLFLIAHIMGLVLFVIYAPYRKVSFNLQYDEDGKPISVGTGEHGTAKLSTYNELRKQHKNYHPKAETDPQNKYPLTSSGLVLNSKIINKRTKDVEVVYMDKDVHTIILGATGSGKTTSFIKPTILTLADSGESMIIHDPKGELKQDYAGYLRNVKGYDVIEMNYSDPRMGDQFNQLENVRRLLKRGQENSYKAKTFETIGKYLEYIMSDGESLNQKSDNHYFKKMMIDSTNGNLAIRYIKDFFVNSYDYAWNKMAHNFYKFYRIEQMTNIALDHLKKYTIEEIRQYFQHRKDYFEEYKTAITTDQSELIQYADRKIRDIQLTLDGISKLDEVNVSILTRYFKELKEEHHRKYKDDEAAANIYARSITNMLLQDSDSARQKGEKIWEDTPKALIVSIILFICRETHLQTSAHMGSVFRFLSELSDPQQGNSAKLRMDTLFEAFVPDDPCRLSQTSVRIAGDRTRSSILVSAVAPLEIFSNDSVIEQGSRTSFDIKGISKKPTAIFVLSAGRDENPVFTVLTSLFVEQTYVSLIEETKHTENLRLPRRVNYLLDELGNMAQIPELASKISLARSRAIRFNLVLQSFTQLDAHYKSDKNTIMENTSWFYLLTQDYETAKQISERLGSYTAEGESQSLNSNSADNVTGGASKQKMARPLYTPDEIMRFKIGTGLAIISSDYPAKVQLLPSFDYPQEKVVQKYRSKNIQQFRPNQQVRFFVPEVEEFIIAYEEYHKTALFDGFWKSFNTSGAETSPAGGGQRKPDNEIEYEDVANQATKEAMGCNQKLIDDAARHAKKSKNPPKTKRGQENHYTKDKAPVEIQEQEQTQKLEVFAEVAATSYAIQVKNYADDNQMPGKELVEVVGLTEALNMTFEMKQRDVVTTKKAIEQQKAQQTQQIKK